MKKNESDAKTVLTRLGELSKFLSDLDAHASIDDSFNFPLEIIQKTMMFDISVLYKISNVIEDMLIIEVVNILDPKDLRLDLKKGRKIRLFLDNRDKRYANEVMAFVNKRTSYFNIPGIGCDIMGYVHLPECFGGAYLFGGDFYGHESSIKDYEVAGVEIMCHFLSAILLKTQFKYQAENDHLTGLYNSGKIKQEVSTILKRHERRPESNTCIVMCDIDFFKKVNDNYGHIQGDLVLKKVGDILSGSLREVFDLAGRYGGEEFLLIFDETNEETAFKITERLRKKIEATKFETADDQANIQTNTPGNIQGNEFLKITMSFGISMLSAGLDLTDAADWIGRADKALYESKQNGRNMTTIFKG